MPTSAAPITYPVAPASVSGNSLTVDQALNNPRIVGRSIRDLLLQKFYADQVFSPVGEMVLSGSVVYEQATENELYLDRDVQQITPGGEYPEVTAHRGQPLTAQSQKFGGRFKVTLEARQANKQSELTRGQTQLVNTILRKTQQRAISELDAAIVANSRTGTGVSWSDATGLTLSTSNKAALPAADLATVAKLNEVLELGYEYDFAIFNPQEWMNLGITYQGDRDNVLTDNGIKGWWVTNRQTAGKAKFLSKGNVGELAYREGLKVRVYEQESRDLTWVQGSIQPIVYVTDPFAVIELDGLAA